MLNTSCTERAQRLLQYCLDGRQWPAELLYEVVDECPAEFFGIVVERLADLFEPRLCDTYASLFSEAIAHVLPVDPKNLIERYKQVRQVRKCTLDPANVFVLSRVTLGADIKVTGIVLEAAKRRFPDAALYFVGGQKCAELFPDVRHLPVEYPRASSLLERLSPATDLHRRLSAPDSIVIDPDSRLTQLGLMRVCEEDRYFFFESRAYGGVGNDDLSTLTRRWVDEVLTAPEGRRQNYRAATKGSGVALSFGVGDNPAKRIADPFESELLRLLAKRFPMIIVDKGAGGEEARRVDRAIADSGIAPHRIRTWEGSFAGFASIIAQSELYVGYDSAGQHAAAAGGVPLLSVFAGFPSPRMFARWRPTGPGKIEVIKVEDSDPLAVLARVELGLDALTL